MSVTNPRLEGEIIQIVRSMQRLAVHDVRERVVKARDAEAERERDAASAGDRGGQQASRRARVVLDELLAEIDRDL